MTNDLQRSAQRRMETFDRLPKDLRTLANEYGLNPVIFGLREVGIHHLKLYLDAMRFRDSIINTNKPNPFLNELNEKLRQEEQMETNREREKNIEFFNLFETLQRSR